MDYKVGDKVRMVGEDMYSELGFIVCEIEGSIMCYIEMVDKIGWVRNNSIPTTYVSVASDTYRTMSKRTFELVEQTKIKTVVNKPTYEWKAERSDGITFERNAIGGRSLKEIEESISERKESIKRDESLLRSHRSLFSKKK